MAGGGAERQLAYLAGEQVRIGCDVHVAIINGGPNLPRLEATGATVHRLPAFGNHDPQILIRLIGIIRAIKPDVVQCWLLQMEVLGGLAALWTGTPWVFSERASQEAYPRTFKMWCRARVGARATVIVSNSQAGDRYWQARAGPRVRRRVIPNGLPLEEIAKVLPATTIDGSPLDPGVPVILNAGRFEPQKNLETFVRAMRLVAAERSVQTLCCGDGSLRNRIERLIADEGITSTIRLERYVTNLWGAMKRADALVSTSLFEGSPNVVLEAMVCACPLVVSDIPEHRELLDEETAIFVNPHHPRSVADGILQVLSDRSAAVRRATAAQARAQRYSLATVARQYTDLYQELLPLHG